MNALHIMELLSHNILPIFETIPLDADDYRAMLERFASLDIRGGTITTVLSHTPLSKPMQSKS